MKYIYPKKQIDKNEINHLLLVFDNGDYLEIKGSELINLKINTYDRLVKNNKGFCSVAQSGFLKLNICNKQSFKNSSHSLHNPEMFHKNRKAYIEYRCINENGIKQIILSDRNNWWSIFNVCINPKLDNGYLILDIIEQPWMGGFESKNYFVNVGEIKKENISKIGLDFENCEHFDIYNSEILDIDLKFNKKLHWNGVDLCRVLDEGILRIKLDKYIQRHSFLSNNAKKLSTKNFEHRLCGTYRNECDICNLYIDYYDYSYSEECVNVDDINDYDEEKFAEFDYGEYDDCRFISGYCKMLKDKSILIAFGKTAKEDIQNYKI